MRVIAAAHGWKLLVADSVRSALTILEIEPVPLIFYDGDLPGIESARYVSHLTIGAGTALHNPGVADYRRLFMAGGD